MNTTQCLQTSLRLRALLVVLSALALVGGAPAALAQVVIDEFATPQGPLAAPPGGSSNVVTGGADIVGDNRNLTVLLVEGAGPVTAEVTGGALEFAIADTTPDSRGDVLLVWDGNDHTSFDPTGLLGVDLTAGGTGGLRFDIAEAPAGASLVVTIYEDGANVSRAGRVLPAIAAPASLFIDWSELVTAPDAVGPADLTNVGAITLQLSGTEIPRLAITHIAAVAPQVAASKVDRTAAGAAIPPAGVNPGDQVRYRVTVTNPGAGAEGVDFDDTVDTNTAIVGGSVRTTPLARRDHYATITDVVFDSVLESAPTLLTNDVDPDGDALVAVVAAGQATTQGGTVDIDAAGDFVYTPPTGFQGVDSFTYELDATAGDPTVDAAGNAIAAITGRAYVIIDRVPPELAGAGTVVFTEDGPAVAVAPALDVTDGDSPNLASATVTLTTVLDGADEMLTAISCGGLTVGGSGTSALTISGSATLAAYQTCLRSVRYENADQDPNGSDRMVDFQVSDGLLSSNIETATVEVIPVNDAPVVTTSGGTSGFIEDGGAIVVDGSLTVTDVDNANIQSAMVVITNVLDVGFESLGSTACGGLMVSGTTTLSISGSASKAAYETCLRSVTYDNTDQDPNATNRSISFKVNDGDVDSALAFKTVTVTPVNDPPVAGSDAWDFIGNTELVVDLALPATPTVAATTGSTFGVLHNDSDPAEGNALTVTSISVGACIDNSAPLDCTDPAVGRVQMQANGRLRFTPAPGDTGATETFQYTVTDDGLPAPASVIGMVTLTRQERVWYVDPTAPGGGDGTSPAPLNSLTPLSGAGGVGDLDVASDRIFVHDGTLALTGPLPLESLQRLLGEGVGLSLPVSLNGNASPTVLVAPGTRPQLTNANAAGPTADAVTAAAAIPREIAGLSLASTNGNAIDVTTSAAYASSTLTIRDNEIRGAGSEGIDVNLAFATASVLTLEVTSNTWNLAGVHTGNAVDVNRANGIVDLAFTGNTNILSTAANAVVIGGNDIASLRLTAFSGNSVHGNTAQAGVSIASATIDADTGTVGFQLVDADNLPVGASGNPVGGAGMVLTGVQGSLFFDDLDVFAASGTALGVSGTGGGMTFSVTPASPDGAGTSTLDADNGPAVDISTATIDLRLADLDSNTAAGGVALSGVGGQFRAPSGSTISKTSGGGTAFSVASSVSGSTVTYAGTLNVTSGAGVSLTSNTGSTIAFSGGMTLSTGTNAGFSATGGGTVSVTDPVGVASNDVTTTTGTAVTVSGTTIGGSGVTFRSVNSTTAGSNVTIVLANTGAGQFMITGDGTSAGTGGTISNKSVDGMTLNNTDGLVTLKNMIFQDLGDNGGAIDTISSDDAIHGQQVDGGLRLEGVTIRRVSDMAIHGATLAGNAATVWNGLTILSSTIEDTNRFHVATVGDSNNEGAIRILGARGTFTVTGSTFQRGGEHIDLFVTAETLDLGVTTSTFNFAYKEFTSGLRSSVAGHCIDVTVQGAGNANVTVGDRINAGLGNTFLNCGFGSVRVGFDAATTGNIDAIVGHNDFTVNDHSSGFGGDFDFPMGGVLYYSLGTDSATFDGVINDNYFDEVTNASGGVGQVSLAMTNGTWQVLVDGNTFDTPGNAPWWLRADSTSSAKVTFQNNTGIKAFFTCPDPACAGGYFAPGLRALADLQNGAVLDLTILGDLFAEHDAGFDPGQTFEARVLPTGGGGTLCLDLQNNQAPDGYSLEEYAGDFNLVGSGTCAVGSPSATCQTLLAARGNRGGANVATTNPPFVNVDPNVVDVVPAACLQPSGPIF